MKTVVGLLGILIVLATVGYTAQRHLRAVDAGASSRAAAARAGSDTVSPTSALRPASSARDGVSAIERDVRDRTAEGLQQGADRAAAADR